MGGKGVVFDILVTGGAGYIGSHTCVALLDAGFSVIIADDLSNSKFEAVSRIRSITGNKVTFYPYDVTDEIELEKIFTRHAIRCVVHFAGKKAVGESVEMPLEYYRTNLMSTISLTRVMNRHNVKNIVFSSSATVYGNSKKVPYSENSPTGNCTNPYAWTKWMNEQILTDIHNSDPDWSVILLRYFNPVGAHPSGQIGEDPLGLPNNLFPYVTQVAVGKLDRLPIFGSDYPTKDGTGVRDFIHVMDLAEGHVSAVKKCVQEYGVQVFNLGTGVGYSVLEVLHAFEEATGKEIPHYFCPRREGDVSVSYASTKKAAAELRWRARRDLRAMCQDAWNWQQLNPQGY
ncbi:MAG: UDP-glucose 4-epimerase GalE [Oscillospiraceae bacterium]|nr:UDP-glucose 4-epimerase GalE [Oscillospiraceae bacterium]